jgi:Ca-activated chloride channel homolog
MLLPMNPNFQHYRWITVLLIALVVGSSLAFSQEPAAPTQTPRPTVQLSLLVSDSKNRPINDLTKDEVEISEEGQLQAISRFEKDTRTTQYAIAIDISGSFRGLLEPALEFVKVIIANKKTEDQFQLIRFISSDKIERVIDYTTDGSKLIDSLKLFKLEMGQSAVVDAIYETVKSVANHRPAESLRRVAIIISDGEDRASYYTTEALVKLLRESDVQVFAVGIVLNLEGERGFTRRSPREKAEALLTSVAKESGGRVFFPRTNGDLVKAATEINQDLQTSYVLAFQPADVTKKGFRKFDLKVAKRSSEELRVITRTGYYLKTRAHDEKDKKNRN